MSVEVSPGDSSAFVKLDDGVRHLVRRAEVHVTRTSPPRQGGPAPLRAPLSQIEDHSARRTSPGRPRCRTAAAGRRRSCGLRTKLAPMVLGLPTGAPRALATVAGMDTWAAAVPDLQGRGQVLAARRPRRVGGGRPPLIGSRCSSPASPPTTTPRISGAPKPLASTSSGGC